MICYSNPGKWFNCFREEIPYCAIYVSRDSYCSVRSVSKHASDMASNCRTSPLVYTNESLPAVKIRAYRRNVKIYADDYIMYKFIHCPTQETTSALHSEADASLSSKIHFIVIIIVLTILSIILLLLFLKQRRSDVKRGKDSAQVQFSTGRNNISVNREPGNNMTGSNPSHEVAYSVIEGNANDTRELVENAIYSVQIHEAKNTHEAEPSKTSPPGEVYAVVRKN